MERRFLNLKPECQVSLFPFETTTVVFIGATLGNMNEVSSQAPVRWYLADWRKSRGLTQEALGFLMGATKSQISKLESGATKWDASWLGRAARALGCEPTDLLFPPGKIPPAEVLRELSPEEQSKVIDLARAFVRRAS